MPVPRTPPELLQLALDTDPARPMLTFYDDATGERTELSVATYANWVAKTANLLVDELGTQAGDRVALRLPCHWQAVVWLGACWATGAVAAPGATAGDVAVVALDDGEVAVPVSAGEVVGLGLGPLGLPRADAPKRPDVTVDYDRVVLGHGDRFVPFARPVGSSTALLLPETLVLPENGESPGGETAAAELVEQALEASARWEIAAGERVLVTDPLDGLASVLASALVPLTDRVGAVLCRHLDQERLPDRIAAERVVAAVSRPASRGSTTSLTSPIPAIRWFDLD